MIGRTACFGLLLALSAAAADEPPPGSYQAMDYGPVIGHTIRAKRPDGNVALKGLAIRLDHDAAVVFDKGLLRYAAASVGGWVKIRKTNYGRLKGKKTAAVEGDQVLATPEVAGWAKDGRFTDPRSGGRGSLPDAWGRYRGYYRHGDRVVLSYRVGATSVLESPKAVQVDEQVGFVRTLRVAATEQAHRMLVAGRSGASDASDGGTALVQNGEATVARLATAAPGARLVATDGRIELRLSPSDKPRVLQVLVAAVPAERRGIVRRLLQQTGEPADLKAMTGGGPSRWKQTLERKGKRAEGDRAYVVDEIPIPFDNPWGSLMRPTGFDFFADGRRAAVCTLNGDVWIVSGIDAALDTVRWERFASGLFEPLGLVVRDGEIFVIERGQLTRLKDLNGDGEADFYENFNSDGNVEPRAFWATLETDPQGNFYFLKNGNRVSGDVPRHGSMIRVSADGERSEVFATGFRSANGLSIGPEGTVLAADQQGNWVPTTRIDRVEADGFYGYRPHAGRSIPKGEYEKPICWVPYAVDNSAGGQVYAHDDRWGPLAGHWVHTSWGRSRLFLLLKERVDGTTQGGVVRFPMEFRSGVMRAHVNPKDGQVYVLGMRGLGWQQSGASADGCFNRIRYTGGPVRMPVGLHAREDGVEIRFACELETSSAADAGNYTVKRWTYKYTEKYGSPELSVKNPGQKGRDTVQVDGVSVSNDGHRVKVKLADMRPVMQMMVKYDLEAADGADVSNTIYHTVHELGRGGDPRDAK